MIVPTDKTRRAFVSRGFGWLAERLRGNALPFIDYVRLMWPIIEPGREFIEGVHIEAICDYLEAVSRGIIKRLIINIPPRYGKSNIATILWPTWEWTVFPSRRFGFCSYSAGLSTQHSLKRRRVIASEVYQKRWGHLVRFERDQNVKTEYENTRRGAMFATSTGGTATGKGGDILVGDDVLNPMTAESDAEREFATDFIDHVWMNRLDNKKFGAMVFIEQRLHPKDITAHLMKSGAWVKLVLPAQFEEETPIYLPYSKRTLLIPAHSVLAPRREGPEELAALKRQMGSRAFSAQYLQRPMEKEGSLLRRAWFKSYTPGVVTDELFRVWSWDTAFKDGQANDFSVGTLWSARASGFYLMKRVKGRMEYPALRREVAEQYAAHPTSAVLIEDAASGQSLIQDLKLTRVPVVPVKVDKDKVLRVNIVAPLFESGQVFVPDAEREPWVVDFRDNLCEFPFAEHDDDVDSATQALTYMKARTSGAPTSGYSANMGAPWGSTGERKPEWA